MPAIEEAIALIDALCLKLKGQHTGGVVTSTAGPFLYPAAAPESAPTGAASAITPALVASGVADSGAAAASAPTSAAVPGSQGDDMDQSQMPKKKEKKKKAAPPPAAPETPADLFGKACLQVARVQSVGDVEGSDKLYKTVVEVADGETRQIIAGLKKHIDRAELEGSLVVVITNLRTAKLAGEASEGMILAGVQTGSDLPNGELVAPIRPPETAEAGQRVYLEGCSPSDSPPKVLKSGPWADIKEKLRVVANGGAYDGIRLITAAGPITVAAGLPEGALIS